MRSLKGVALVVAATALVAAAHASAGAPTTVSQTYTVGSLTVPGASTGLVLAGGSVTVTGSGSVCPFGLFGACFGPNGTTSHDTTVSSYGGFVLPGAPAWGLVGRVGAGPWIQIGTGPTTLSGIGQVVFAVNDDLFSDNRGSFSATVSWSCWPGWGYGDKNHTHCGPPGLAVAAGHANGNSGNGNGAASHGQPDPRAAGCSQPPCGGKK